MRPAVVLLAFTPALLAVAKAVRSRLADLAKVFPERVTSKVIDDEP